MEEFLVRVATPNDAEVLAKIHVDAWRTAYAGVMPDAYLAKLSLDQKAIEWRERLTTLGDASPTPRATTLVAERDGEVHGWVTYGPNRDPDVNEGGELFALNLHPTFFGQGAGLSLLSAAESGLMNFGYREWILWVLQENPRARHFYSKYGYSADGPGKDISFGEKDVHALRYRKVGT